MLGASTGTEQCPSERFCEGAKQLWAETHCRWAELVQEQIPECPGEVGGQPGSAKGDSNDRAEQWECFGVGGGGALTLCRKHSWYHKTGDTGDTCSEVGDSLECAPPMLAGFIGVELKEMESVTLFLSEHICSLSFSFK